MSGEPSLKIAVYPGSFDPITLGHLNIIRRASRIFDKVYVCVMVNSAKKYMFSLEERLDFISRAACRFQNVEVEHSEKLVVEYAKEKNANVIIRGLRAVSDFDSEFQMALTNSKIEPSVETMFLASGESYTYLSSTVVKEMAKYGADLGKFVPCEIIDDIEKKIKNRG